MKFIRLLVLWTVVPTIAPVFAQPASSAQATVTEAQPKLTKFDLDFPGGTPGELVAAIQKALGRPLNAIIQSQDAKVQLPALKMSGVDVAQLFRALTAGSNRQTFNRAGYAELQLGFETVGQLSDDSIWFFFVRQPALPPKTTQFFLLTPYLKNGLTVDDITTAVQTAWKMSGSTEGATLSFHKETNLLIAAGDSQSIGTVMQALAALRQPDEKPAPSEKKP